VSTDDDVDLRTVLDEGALVTAFQPIVDLDRQEVVAFEALTRGPDGPLRSPAALFAAARRQGLLAALDEACRMTAFRNAAAQGLTAPVPVFVNVEPEVLEREPLEVLAAQAAASPADLRIVLEITERALATRPAELLHTVERVRELGWGVALDDVGADALSLAFMPLLRPDVVKLDLRLVQNRTTPAVAEIMNAVNAYAERSGALLLAEGIESEQHLAVARGLGAVLGQGWLFGRPEEAVAAEVGGELVFPTAVVLDQGSLRSPFSRLRPGTPLRTAPKRLLVELSKQLEREAMRTGEACVVASTFQHRRHFTPATVQRYRDLVARTGFACAIGEGLDDTLVPGLRGADITRDDPLSHEWDVVVLSPHFAAALLARDLGDDGPDLGRTFEYALTYDRDVVVEAAHGLLSRVVPVAGEPYPEPDPVPAPRPVLVGPAVDEPGRQEHLLERALAATTNGVTIADMTRPDQPLVLVNGAFEQLAGFPESELLGRNCRFLQGEDTDRTAVRRLREAVAEGREAHETLLNYRGPDRTPWWNEVHLSPIRDERGRVVQYVGVQNDVTVRVEAERALRLERDRARSYLERIEQLAWTDPLTGLMNRRRLAEQVEAELWEARLRGDGLALLFMDLDRFKPVNDTLGHSAGDELLQEVARRLRGRVRRRDLLARLGGDEFLLAMTGLDPDEAGVQAGQVAHELVAAMAEPFTVRGAEVRVALSVGISTFPHDAHDFDGLLHEADLRMYSAKQQRERA
jgi:diguanylate cyclase (GGDEF)-like protein/PAS domain S-box-containing protein